MWCADQRVGFITSGGYGHWVGRSLALAYIERDILKNTNELFVHVVGSKCSAQVLNEVPHDPTGARMRS